MTPKKVAYAHSGKVNIGFNPLWLLGLIPICLALRWLDVSPVWIFLTALGAIYALAEVMADATQRLANTLGPTLGGLLNASLNNAPEIIIAFFALKHGLGDVVKASITGSILVELLLGLGLGMFLGGLRNGTQSFNQASIQVNASLLTLCSFALIIPALFNLGAGDKEMGLSRDISLILLLIYAVKLATSLKPTSLNKQLPAEPPKKPVPAEPEGRAGIVLVASTLGLAVMSEVITDALEPTSKLLGLSDLFSGMILLAGAGGIGEIVSTTRFALNNKMDLAIEASVGSSIQMILFAVPLLIFAAPLVGTDMNLLFSHFEIATILLTSVIIRILTMDGASTWFEGMMLVALYLMLGIGFYHLPAPT
jgi:Ca2+:H+ antiporter